MKRIKTEKELLDENIALLQIEQDLKLKLFKQQLHLTYESLKPVNFIKNTMEEAISSPDLKKDLLNNLIGLATGYISKKIILGGSHNPIKNLFGSVLQFLITNVVAKNSDSIVESGEKVLSFLTKKKTNSNHYPNYH